MVEKDFCSDCAQNHNCGDVYRQLANATGPSVVSGVCLAFLLPIAVFIVALVIYQDIFSEIVTNEKLRIALSLPPAAGTGFVGILVSRKIASKLAKTKNGYVAKGD